MQNRSPIFLDILAAAQRIHPYVRRTPLEPAREGFSANLFLKLENWQRTGSFKARGAMNRLLLLSADERRSGVITASAGNHGLGVAMAAGILGIPATIVVPENAAETKVAALRRYPITLVEHGRDYDEAETHARSLAEERGLCFVHAFEDPEVIAGQGTVGWEILDERPETSRLIVPIGGGGLIAGVALAAKSIRPDVTIVGIQPQASPAMVRALQEGAVVETPIEPTVADGLAGRFVSELTLELCQKYVDDVVTVSEDSIRAAMRRLLYDQHLLVEGSAAVGLAALLEGSVPASQEETAIIITGRNVSHTVLQQVVC